MQNKVEDKNINLRKKRYRTNHCVAEQEIYNHHLIVHSKPKVLGLGTDQVVKESPKVKNLTVYRSCFLLATPLIQKYLIILKKSRVKMIGCILCFADKLEDILRKASIRRKFFVNGTVTSLTKPSKARTAQFLQPFSSFCLRKYLSTLIYFHYYVICIMFLRYKSNWMKSLLLPSNSISKQN